MLHMAGPYEPGCPTVINGIPVNTYRGVWTIDAWQASLNVKYYWSGQHSGCITYLPPLVAQYFTPVLRRQGAVGELGRAQQVRARGGRDGG